MKKVSQWQVIELEFVSTGIYNNPLIDITATVNFFSPSGRNLPVGSFWDGGQVWRVRFSPDEVGQWSWHSTCTLPEDSGLHNQTGEFECARYNGENPLYLHGALTLSENRHHMIYADETPFFWLADTAWNGVLRAHPADWQRYLEIRQQQKFTVIQFVLTQWRGSSTDVAGELAYSGDDPIAINPAFFQRMDTKIQAINAHGFIASPVMLWALKPYDPGQALSVQDRIRLARYQLARYGAYQVVWILGGDGCYDDVIENWREIGRAVFKDRHDRLVTMHPCGANWSTSALREETWFDFIGYQSGHGGTYEHIRWATQGPPSTDWQIQPGLPVIDMEPNYQNHPSTKNCVKTIFTDHEVRRASYWSLLVSPPAGVTYGTNPIWVWREDVGEAEDHVGLGDVLPWQYGLQFPGAESMTHLRHLFETVHWWEFRPAQHLLKEQPGGQDSNQFIAAGMTTDEQNILIYTPVGGTITLNAEALHAQAQVRWYDPRIGKWIATSEAENGIYRTPDNRDWCLLISFSLT